MKKNRSVEEKAAFIKDVKSKIDNSALSVSEKQKMFEKLNTLTSPNVESSACFVGDFVESTFSNKNVIIKKSDCSSWPCGSGFDAYSGDIGIKEVNEKYNNINYCDYSFNHVYPPAAGIFKPLFDEEYPNSISNKIKDQLLVDFNLEVCFGNSDYWKYQIQGDTIFLRAILDVCEDNILSGPTESIIHNIDELSVIPNEEVCLALENFEKQRVYGNGGKYYLIAPVWVHEKVHKANFEKLITKVLNMKRRYFGEEYKYRDLLASVFRPECDEVTSDKNKARFQVKKYLDTILSLVTIDLFKLYNMAKSNKDDEIKTQNNPDVQWKITEYKKALQKNRSKEFWQDCPYKEKDI